MTLNHESTANGPRFESGMDKEFPNPDVKINAMAALAAKTVEWTRQAAVDNANAVAQGRPTEVKNGLSIADFKRFVGSQIPGMEPAANTTMAARLENDAMRFTHNMPMPENPAGLDTVSPTAEINPIDVLTYAAHMVKSTGASLENTPVGDYLGSAIDATNEARGIDPRSSQVMRQEILQTV